MLAVLVFQTLPEFLLHILLVDLEKMAFRKLRQFSSRLDIPETELDINGTVDKTCNNGGCLQIVMQKPPILGFSHTTFLYFFFISCSHS